VLVVAEDSCEAWSKFVSAVVLRIVVSVGYFDVVDGDAGVRVGDGGAPG
jgi:hypothetical protein